MESYDIEYIQDAIKYIFAKPEREQAAGWVKEIAEIEEDYRERGSNDESFKEAIEIIKSIAHQAKYFA